MTAFKQRILDVYYTGGRLNYLTIVIDIIVIVGTAALIGAAFYATLFA